jgi:hypothetical protein
MSRKKHTKKKFINVDTANIPAQFKDFGKKHVIISFLLIAVIGYGVYWLVSVQMEKREYEKANKQITALAEELKKAEPRLQNQTFEKSCGRSSAKFGDGPLYCDVTTSLSVNSIEQTDQLELTKGINEMINKSPLVIESPPQKSFGTDLTSSLKFRIETMNKSFKFKDTLDGLGCAIYYTSKPDSLEVSLICSGPAKQVYFLGSAGRR